MGKVRKRDSSCVYARDRISCAGPHFPGRGMLRSLPRIFGMMSCPKDSDLDDTFSKERRTA